MKEFKIVPRVTHTGRIVSFASFSGYKTIEEVIQRIKTDRFQLHRAFLLDAIAAGAYWESI